MNVKPSRIVGWRLSVPGLVTLVLGVALFAWLGAPAAAQAQSLSFSDVPASNPYHLQIEVLAELGVIGGKSDGQFHPNDPVTREQFAKMLVLAMRISASLTDQCSFSDVPKSGGSELYPDHYIAAAAAKGIVTGYVEAGKPVFRPYAPITLGQLVAMGTRASARPLKQVPAGCESSWGKFNQDLAPFANEAQYNGLLWGFSLSKMSPWRSATRAEAAAFLFSVMGTDPAGLNGRFLGTATDLANYFRSAGHTSGKFTVGLDTLASLYVTYGSRFGIRADMAWAQMIHETGFGNYGGDVSPAQNNFAGIGAVGGGAPGDSFATAEMGVIAQYVHLACYLYPQDLPDPYCVPSSDPTKPGDPRYFTTASRRGSVRTVFDLDDKWAVPGDGYGAAIQKLADGVMQAAGWPSAL
jgi:hypothetical protein